MPTKTGATFRCVCRTLSVKGGGAGFAIASEYIQAGAVKIFPHLQAKILKHQAFEAEIAAHNNAILTLKTSGRSMVDQNHFASDAIKVSLSHKPLS